MWLCEFYANIKFIWQIIYWYHIHFSLSLLLPLNIFFFYIHTNISLYHYCLFSILFAIAFKSCIATESTKKIAWRPSKKKMKGYRKEGKAKERLLGFINNYYASLRLDSWYLHKYIQQKRFYDRESNSAAFCVIQLMSFKPPFSSMKLNN